MNDAVVLYGKYGAEVVEIEAAASFGLPGPMGFCLMAIGFMTRRWIDFKRHVAAPEVAATRSTARALVRHAESRAQSARNQEEAARNRSERLEDEVSALATRADADRRRADELDEATKCVACLDAPRSQRLDPCGHLCLCQPCSVGLDSCPICRATIAASTRTFL